MNTHIYPNGDTYKGKLVNNKRTGSGLYTYARKNSKYSGYFQNDKKNGMGTYLYKDGEIYLGGFKNDLKGE